MLINAALFNIMSINTVLTNRVTLINAVLILKEVLIAHTVGEKKNLNTFLVKIAQNVAIFMNRFLMISTHLELFCDVFELRFEVLVMKI